MKIASSIVKRLARTGGIYRWARAFIPVGLLFMMAGCASNTSQFTANEKKQVKSGVQAYINGDRTQAQHKLQPVAVRGHAQAQYYLGMIHKKQGEYGQAYAWFLRSAKQGFAEAQFQMGEIYYEGLGREKNANHAVYWYRHAAEAGHGRAQALMSQFYSDGIGIEKDARQALRWLQKSAVADEADSQFTLAVFYLHGRHVKQNVRLAIRWLKEAGGQDYAPALTLLAVMYLNGDHVPQNINSARHYFSRAIQGNEAFFLNFYAWALSVSDVAGFRDGMLAVELAQKALSQSGQRGSILDTLAAAYAEMGDFQRAVDYQQQAMALMRDTGFYPGARQRLQYYEQKRPWRETIRFINDN